MPGLDSLALTPSERRVKQWEELQENCLCGRAEEWEMCALGFFMLGFVGVFIGIIGALSYFVNNDVIVQTAPRECFELREGCEVVQVVHSVLLNEEPCQDRFTYHFRGVGSPAVYFQREFIERVGSNCSADDVGKINGTFQVGPTACLVRHDRFSDYDKGVFNCATRSSASDNPDPANQNECFTLLEPQSNFEPVNSFVALAVFLVMCCVLALKVAAEGDGQMQL